LGHLSVEPPGAGSTQVVTPPITLKVDAAVVQKRLPCLALNANAPPTTATNVSDSNMNFILFIIDFAFYNQKAKVWFKNSLPFLSGF
jgi:hypothetical protein